MTAHAVVVAAAACFDLCGMQRQQTAAQCNFCALARGFESHTKAKLLSKMGPQASTACAVRLVYGRCEDSGVTLRLLRARLELSLERGRQVASNRQTTQGAAEKRVREVLLREGRRHRAAHVKFLRLELVFRDAALLDG